MSNSNNNKDYWCPYPFHYVMLTPNMEIRPCCRFETHTSSNIEVLESSSEIVDKFKNSYFKDIRENIRQNKPVTGCEKCYQEEQANIPSLRQKTIYEKSLPLNSDESITALEIGVGRLCNLKCRTCSSQYSTKWDQDEKELGLPMPNFKAQKELDLENFPVELFKDLKELKITGGEPFFSKSFLIFLENFKNSGHSSECEIEVFTNGTIFPKDNVLESLNSFKSTRISLSIDSTKEKNDYIRSPSKWDQVTPIFKDWYLWSQQANNRTIWIANTINTLNICDTFSFMDWCETFFSKDIKIVFQILHGPKYLAVANLPKEIKNDINQHLMGELENKYPHLNREKNERNIKKVFNTLIQAPQDEQNQVQDFLKITGQLDRLRNEDFKKTFPELNHFISQYHHE